MEVAEQSLEVAAAKIADGNGYLITTESVWSKLQRAQPKLSPPLLHSRGKGPEGDAPLVLARAVLP